ncbi:MAG: type II toxin-antitoxin system HicA family toxin [Paracoccaceae bacterium]|nr:type II toxin-antitoxin system HicA family toxin [Paracoccaceae bacterium]
MKIDEAIELLEVKRASLKCAELIAMLEGFGFEVRESGRHYVFKHSELREQLDFKASNFACKHGRNSGVKPGYVGKIKRMLTTQKDALLELGYD